MNYYRIVRVYERYYVESLRATKFFTKFWRRISPRGGFSTAIEARQWWRLHGAERGTDFEVIAEWTR